MGVRLGQMVEVTKILHPGRRRDRSAASRVAESKGWGSASPCTLLVIHKTPVRNLRDNLNNHAGLVLCRV